MIARMAATARIIPKTDVSVPRTDARPAGSGFGAMHPSWLRYLGTSTFVLAPVCRTFRGANRERCVNYFTLRIIVILMETIKDLYISADRLRLPSPPDPGRGDGEGLHWAIAGESGTQSRI